MTQLTTLLHTLDDLNVEDLAALPVEDKAALQDRLAIAARWLQAAQAKFDEALELAYGTQCRQALKATGRDFGAVHIEDRAVSITFDLPKKVKWDQAQLARLAERIVASGEQASDYIDAKLSISETRWKSWPAVLQQQFAAARTVEPGKPSITVGGR